VKLRYTLRAAAELDEVLTYIEERSPQGARRVQTRIQVVIDLLLRHPHAGQLTSKGRLRRMVASPYPYLIFYQAAEDEIVIHGVRHSARRPSSMPE
jgi:toxin ParE1/3/4